MNKQQLITDLHRLTGISRSDCETVINGYHGAITGCLEATGEFTLHRIGKLTTVARSARAGRNPATGESLQIPASVGIKFKAAKALKEAVQ